MTVHVLLLEKKVFEKVRTLANPRLIFVASASIDGSHYVVGIVSIASLGGKYFLHKYYIWFACRIHVFSTMQLSLLIAMRNISE